jgi:hypothetical protein
MTVIQSVIPTSMNETQNKALNYLNLQLALCDPLRNWPGSNHLNSLHSLQKMINSTSSANRRWQGTSK